MVLRNEQNQHQNLKNQWNDNFFKFFVKHDTIKTVWFYGISTIVGYLIPNAVYTYIQYMICKKIVKEF